MEYKDGDLQVDKLTGIELGDSWEDLRFPLFGQNIDTSAGRVDFNYSEGTVDFQSTAKYPDDAVFFIVQMPHAKKLGSAIFPHIHFIQNQNKQPNFLMEYRWYNTDEAVPSTWTPVPVNGCIAAYTSGNISQLCTFPNITKSDETLSSIMQIKLYRDTNNDSGLFAGDDPYVGDVSVLEFDIHYISDTTGSQTEFNKRSTTCS